MKNLRPSKQVLYLRVDRATMALVDAEEQRLKKANPGLSIGRTAAAISLLHKGAKHG